MVRVTAKTGERGGVHAAVYFAFHDAGLIVRIEAYANYIPEGKTS